MMWAQLNCQPPSQQLSVCVVKHFVMSKMLISRQKTIVTSDYDKTRVPIKIVRFPPMYILALSGEEQQRRRSLQPYPRTLDGNVSTVEEFDRTTGRSATVCILQERRLKYYVLLSRCST